MVDVAAKTAVAPEVSDEVRAQIKAEIVADYTVQLAAAKAELELDLRAEFEKTLQEVRKSAATTAAKPVKVKAAPLNPGSVTVHFIDDGFTAPYGKSKYKGDEMTVEPKTPLWAAMTEPVSGVMTLNLTPREQVKKWGRQLFVQGSLKDKVDEDDD